jgi:hypothetical protein
MSGCRPIPIEPPPPAIKLGVAVLGRQPDVFGDLHGNAAAKSPTFERGYGEIAASRAEHGQITCVHARPADEAIDQRRWIDE